MANGPVPQPPPVGGPAPQRQAPPINVAQILGQLSSSPPVGPLPVTPYAPANVGPLAMPGAGLAGAQSTPPPWTGAPKAQPQQPAQPSVGSLMQPGTVAGGGKGEEHTGALANQQAAQQSPYAQQMIKELLGRSPMPAVMHQPVAVPPARTQVNPLQIPRPAAPVAPRAPAPAVAPRTQIDPLTGRPVVYQQPMGAPRNM
jgi:hypothetical protein